MRHMTWVWILFFQGVSASAQTYPLRPVHLVTAEPGGTNDFAARIIAQGLSTAFGQQVIVENRGGAGGAIAAQSVARAAPDGYTIMLYGPAIWLLPYLRTSVPWDPIKDFAPITLAVMAPNIIAVHPALPVRGVLDLLKLARARPGELNDASAGIGTSTHIAAEIFKVMTGVSIVRVPYKGSGPALNALIGGQVQLMFAAAAAVAPHIRAGRVRALAVTSAQPSPLAPGLPTVAASGVPGYEAVQMSGVLAPARTPDAILNRLNQEIVRILQRPEIKEKFFNAGVETVGGTAEHFSQTMRSEMNRLGKLIREAGIRDD